MGTGGRFCVHWFTEVQYFSKIYVSCKIVGRLAEWSLPVAFRKSAFNHFGY